MNFHEMPQQEARKKLGKLLLAFDDNPSMTVIAEALEMDLTLYETAQDWQDAVLVRLADLKRAAGVKL